MSNVEDHTEEEEADTDKDTSRYPLELSTIFFLSMIISLLFSSDYIESKLPLMHPIILFINTSA